VSLSVVIITFNEEANIARTLASVKPLVEDGEIIIVDSGSTDRTVEIAKSFGAKVFVERWKGFAAQKNSAIDKATGDWILSLDADEEVSSELTSEFSLLMQSDIMNHEGRLERAKQLRYVATRRSFHEMRSLTKRSGLPQDALFATFTGFWIHRKNFFLGRWIKHGGFWPDPKLRFFRRGAARFEDRAVHEDAKLIEGITGQLKHPVLHHAYPNLSDYIEHMNRYSTLGAEMAVAKGCRGFSVIDIVLRPVATFVYNYIFRLGFLDGREGLLLHLYHSVYVSWKYAKAWEMSHSQTADSSPRSE
jgi:glycosyltransferase involved in cell wall biosynthesis